MLSIDECRALIPDSDRLSDDEIKQIRDDHYELIQLAFEIWWEGKVRARGVEKIVENSHVDVQRIKQ